MDACTVSSGYSVAEADLYLCLERLRFWKKVKQAKRWRAAKKEAAQPAQPRKSPRKTSSSRTARR